MYTRNIIIITVFFLYADKNTFLLYSLKCKMFRHQIGCCHTTDNELLIVHSIFTAGEAAFVEDPLWTEETDSEMRTDRKMTTKGRITDSIRRWRSGDAKQRWTD